MAAAPSLQAIWLADDVDKDEATGKVNISGVFDRIDIEHPATAFTNPAVLFFSLRDVRGEVALVLRYVDLVDNSILLERSVRVCHEDPMITFDVVVTVSSIPVPHPGVYAWELSYNETPLGSCRVRAFVANLPGDGHEGGAAK